VGEIGVAADQQAIPAGGDRLRRLVDREGIEAVFGIFFRVDLNLAALRL
jgi:hypothetical protein